MVTHVFDQGVLVICFPAGIGVGGRAAAAVEAEQLIKLHHPRHVVVELAADAVTPVAVSLVLRTHRSCRASGASLAVVTSAPGARRLITASAGGSGPAVFESRAEAIRQACGGHELAS